MSAPVERRLPRWRFGEGEVVVLATVQGLVAERERVRTALHREKPRIVAVGLSPEAAGVMLRYEKAADEDHFEDLPDHDYVYSVKLSEFGPVDLPPPDLLEAVRLGSEMGAEVVGVDMPEDVYEELFTKTVSTFGFLRYGRIQRSLAKRPPRADDARQFALVWDARIRKVKGIRRVEAAREVFMAEAAARRARDAGVRLLLVIDVPREAGVIEALERLASRPAPSPGVGETRE